MLNHAIAVMKAPEKLSDRVETLREMVADLQLEDLVGSKFQEAILPFLEYDLDGKRDPGLYLEDAKRILGEAVTLIAELGRQPYQICGKHGFASQPAVLVGIADLDQTELQGADAINLIASCPRLREALYRPGLGLAH